MSGGGAGAPANTTSTVTTSTIPTYAQPYAKAMMGGALKQAFNVDDKGNITSAKAYSPFTAMSDADYNAAIGQASKAVAGFDPLQEQAFTGIAGLQLPGGYANADANTAQAIQRAGDVSGRYSGLSEGAGTGALGIGALGMQAGMGYGQQATDANAVQAYMNPYLKDALAPGLQQLQQQMGIKGAAQQGAATSSGAFGGSRAALANALNTQAGNLAQQQMIGQGYQNAYDTAQRNMQMASQLGMQGAGMGLQGIQQALAGYGLAGQLGLEGTRQQMAGAAQQGALAGQELQGQEGIYGLQMQAGGMKQQQAQNIRNQAMQDYMAAQQYPYQQYSFLSNILRGLPMSSSTSQTYQAAPSGMSQVAGLGLGAAGLAKTAGMFANGGIVDLAMADALRG